MRARHLTYFPLFLSLLTPFGCDLSTQRSKKDSQKSLEYSVEQCEALPEAKSADWQRGGDLESIAESTSERVYAVGEETWELALDLLRLTDSAEHPSVAASPASMYFAMGLTYGRHCQDEIARTMRFPESGDEIHHTLGTAIRELESRSLRGDGENDPVNVSFRPSIWEFSPSAPDDLLRYYGGQLHSVDRTAPAEDIRTVMNCVIEQQSQGLLVEFMPAEYPKPDTSSFDVNVSYLQAGWSQEFVDNEKIEFYSEINTAVSIDSIFGSSISAEYLETDDLVAVDLSLRGDRLSVLIAMPREGSYPTLQAFSESLNGEALRGIAEGTVDSYLDLTLPIVQIDSKTIDYYGPLGLNCPPYTLRAVLHGAALEWDKDGIRAAAATVNENWEDSGGGPDEVIPVKIDRPFLFFVHDSETNFVLYSGRYMGPGE